MYQKIKNKQEKISVIGLGYVGLPIALEFARKASVIGFDIKPERIELMKKGTDPSNELEAHEFDGCDIQFTANAEDLKLARFHIVAVPTPIDKHNQPDLTPLLAATRTVGRYLKKGDYVVYESTVYPGCTEEDCVPLLEELSGLKMGSDFKVGFSPERINPGDKVHTLTTITKVVSGNDAETLVNIAQVYEMVIKAGIHRAPTIKVAEAAKIIENTQRDVNIALMNELSLIFNRMGINTYDVLEAAGTKWNFLKFFPGLVGGHCIGVDPYYLLYKAKELGYHAKMIDSGRFINDSMGGYVAKQLVKKMIAKDINIKGARVLVMGVTFKEDVSDIRNSKVVDLINELKQYSIKVDVIDPQASHHEIKEEYGFDMVKTTTGKYDGVVVAVQHEEYKNLPESYFKELMNPNAIFVDLKGIYRSKLNNLNYWSL
ncbi:MAG TPA: nucleotide sugar dehydrogenase [Marinilabiliales bacterium]|nr:MAG: UDP-N-acetyl-D-galactosamine dehydrogenase [Bacteroidetes bacterium GWA2_40_14]OFX75036.1 MAG: UDP-N-acetyl-D-galactosamine dehydrogenase [Bacteroidetes bacterium GWD2_40_43]OFX89628.1 MAG: UDP-N-acetyl-D-galactosamine dehydrogenase [Bacteroidetes bacterium GWE2_40_63]OFZ26338.1 MAG: UDP-N-acetyl-D-galactosamine dehydrogenase [Bacteroidetes bacterium RIFOXYC2_FULL_40_12]HAM99565.1 nucleotide sugar dehydrogenase [Marinilabiliales bacterium]